MAPTLNSPHPHCEDALTDAATLFIASRCKSCRWYEARAPFQVKGEWVFDAMQCAEDSATFKYGGQHCKLYEREPGAD